MPIRCHSKTEEGGFHVQKAGCSWWQQPNVVTHFLESSLNNPYLDSSTQYGLSGFGGNYPELDYGSAILPGGGSIDIEYQPTVTIAQLLQPDGSIGTVSISRVGLYAKVYEGTTNSSMAKGAGHYAGSSCWSGNVGLFGHNRGRGVDHFAELKDVRVGGHRDLQDEPGHPFL